MDKRGEAWDMKVLFDSSFLMAVVDHPTTWFEDITQLVGKFRPTLLDCTVKELERISTKRLKKSRTAALALELAEDFEIEKSGNGRVDDEIASYALGNHSAVATVDRELIGTLKARKLTVLGLRGGRVALF